MNSLHSIRWALMTVACSAWCWGAEYRLPRNQTHVREDHHEARTTAYDVRSSTPLTLPAGMPIGRGSVGVGYHFRDVDWDDIEPSEQGDRHEVRGVLRTRIWQHWGAEIEFVGADSDHADGLTVGDLQIRTTMPLRQERYSAVLVTLGWRAPLGDGKDLEVSHAADDFGGSGGELGLRWTESVSLATVHVNLSGAFHPNAINDLEQALTTEDGTVIPEGDFEHQFYEGSAAVSIGYRFSRWWRAGIDAGATIRRWEGDDDDQDFEDVNLSTIGWIGLNWRPGSQLTLGAGVDPDLLGADESDALILSGAVELDF